MVRLFVGGLLCGLLLTAATARADEPQAADDFAIWLDELSRQVPERAESYPAGNFDELLAAADAVERWSAVFATYDTGATPDDVLERLGRLLDAKQRVDHLLDSTLALRGQFAEQSDRDDFRDALRGYLRTNSQLIQLSGRLRYAQYDAVDGARHRLKSLDDRQRLLDLLTEYRSSIGAAALSPVLYTPLVPAAEQPPESPGPRRRLGGLIGRNEPTASQPGVDPRELRWRLQLVQLMGQTGESALLPILAELVQQPEHPPQLIVEMAEAIRQIGLPQVPREEAREGEQSSQSITPNVLYAVLERIDASRLDAATAQRRDELKAWVDVRRREGIIEESYRFGGHELRPGDWLLMRNPSPYNLFTDLAPGLFTHVGVLAMEQGTDGVRRLVLVDLPERGRSIPATNIDAYLGRTLHYAFLRHPDPQVAQTMADAAASMIGNESQFDLNFRTDRVNALQGESLAGRKIHTYCAGLLLLCAQQTTAPRSEFFPVTEFCAPGHTAANLAKLGLSVGDDFVSPSGALFSPVLELVGRREPMYEPGREIEEAVYDHFAHCLEVKVLVQAPDLRQALVQKLAEAAQQNPMLAAALARAANVSEDTDLVSAAKAAAVVETLDEIAYGRSGEFLDAFDSLRAGSMEALRSEGFGEEELAMVTRYRQRHAELFQQWTAGRLTPRHLRIALVKYYSAAGRDDLERRFFVDDPSAAAAPPTPSGN